jgi:PAS domain S-box-containing protein
VPKHRKYNFINIFIDTKRSFFYTSYSLLLQHTFNYPQSAEGIERMKTVEKAKYSKRKIPSTAAKSLIVKTSKAPKKISVSSSKPSKKLKNDEHEGLLKKSKLLFHLNPTLIALVSLPEKKVIDINEACLKTFGFPRKEVIGKTGDELNIFVQLEKKQKALEELLERGYIDNYELKFRRKDGTILYGLVSGEIIELQGKTYILIIMTDQTSRKRSEKAQRKSEEKYRTILEDIQEGYFEIDLAGNFTFFNDSVYRSLGYSKEELMGMNNRQYTDKETAKKVLHTFNQVYNTGKPIKGFHWQVIRKDGTKIYIEGSVSLLKDLSGKPIGFRGITHDITEREWTEEKLRREEQRFRALAEQSSDIIVLINREGAITSANPAVKRILGFKPEERIGGSIFEFVHPDDLMLATDKFNKSFRNVNAPDSQFEIRIRHKDGSWHTFELVGRKLIQNNVIEAGIINLRDITERKKAEELLKKSEALYRLLADHMKDQIWIMDLGLKVTYISPSVEKLLGYTLEELKELPLDKLFTSASFKAAMDFFSIEMPKAQKAPATYTLKRSLELEFRCKNGRTLWGECMFSFIRDENGRPLSILGEGRNITERKQIEYELRASENNFRHSLDDSPLGVRISTIEGETVYANRAILNIYGYDSIEELKKTPLKKRYTPESYAEWQTRKKERLQGEFGPSEYEISIVRKNGEVRNLYVFRKEIFWNGKKQSQVIYQDITLRRQAEEKLHEILKNLRESIKITIQVLGTASEARDPYTAGHQKRVADLARAIATEMKLPHDKIEGIRMAGAIHDIGKISIPSEILCKPTTLSELEFSLIKAHTQYSYEIMKEVESPWPLADIVYQHHERMNGSGYPHGLEGEKILIEARVLAVADVVEAMISFRPYRPALGLEIALTEIERNAGTLYDRNVANACLKLFREKEFKLE